MQIYTCDQGTPEWLEARMGIPTASEFSTVLAKGKAGAESKTRNTYLRKLAGEVLTGEPMESFGNAHTERGKEMEEEARNFYSFMSDLEPELVGFIRNGQKGCSPDALVGNNGMLEIKTKLPHLQIECLERTTVPPEHLAQCQGALWVAEREWVDFVSYWPKLPLFRVRVYRDEAYIAQLSDAVDKFNDELAALIAKVRGYETVLAEAA